MVRGKGEALAEVTLAGSGKVLEVSLETKYLSGTLTDLGRPAAIALAEVSALQVLRPAG